MSPLLPILRGLIEEKGPLPLDSFMNLCLSHPEHGYYRKRDPLGRQGDFTTAPEISQMFGELIGIWCVERWQAMGSPASFNIVELGPGRGTLMSDALRAGKASPGFIEGLKLHLVEINDSLRRQQKQALKAYDPVWYESIEDLKLKGPTLWIGNEFFDALPIQQFISKDGIWHERCVEFDTHKDELCYVDLVSKEVPVMGEQPAGTLFETCPLAQSILAKISAHIKIHGGCGLFIDYGYSRGEKGDTFQALKDHQPVSPLAFPGQSDLTAHVDFQKLVEIAYRQGAQPHGPVTQEAFLNGLGIAVRAQALQEGKHESLQEEVKRAHLRLTSPKEMGNLFKVLAITDSNQTVPCGFHV